MRTGIPGEPIIDHLSVFEDDGYTKHPGLIISDFTVTVWRDGNDIPYTVSIVEVDAMGEYLVSFIPSVVGFWKVEAWCHYNDDIFITEVEVRSTDTSGIEELLQNIMDGGTGAFVAPDDSLHSLKADLRRVLGLLHRNAILDRQTYDDLGRLTSARLRVFTERSKVPAIPGGEEVDGLLHKYTIESTYDAYGETKFRLLEDL